MQGLVKMVLKNNNHESDTIFLIIYAIFNIETKERPIVSRKKTEEAAIVRIWILLI